MSTPQRFDKEVYDAKNGPARDGSVKKKFTFDEFFKQSTKREMHS